MLTKILSLINKCDSEHITCDLCKWENYGICNTELAYILVLKHLNTFSNIDLIILKDLKFDIDKMKKAI